MPALDVWLTAAAFARVCVAMQGGRASFESLEVRRFKLAQLVGGLKRQELAHVKDYYQAFFWVLIDLIVELLGLIIKPFDNQAES